MGRPKKIDADTEVWEGIVPGAGPKPAKLKLLTYTIKAVIPTGMYSNIQPEITVEADSLERAERAVMPHIEALFAKYRENGAGLPVHKKEPVSVILAKNVGAEDIKKGDAVAVAPSGVIAQAAQKVADPVQPTIVMPAPFNKAKSAIDSCMSIEALQLVLNQIDKSERLIASEKVELRLLVSAKEIALTTPKA